MSDLSSAPRKTYLIVDGENIDATLGVNVLGHRPTPDERPRWDRISDFAANVWDQPVQGLFFLNATSGQMPMGFVQALLAMDFTPIPLAGNGAEKVVDIGIQRTMDAILARGVGNVLLASHDGDYIPQVEALLDAGHEVGVLAFREFVNAELQHLGERGLTIHDLEDSVGAFNAVLPRVRIIPLEVFDPTRYLL